MNASLRYILASFLFLIPEAAFATRLRAPDFTLTLRKSGSAAFVDAAAPAGHHFNTEAPMSLQTGAQKLKPAKAEPASANFEVLTSAIRETEAKVSLDLCDDAKSFCEMHVVLARWDEAQGRLVARSVAETRGVQQAD